MRATWRRSLFCVTLCLFVLGRGLALASLLMPFEGWDEYAHLAVVAYVKQHGAMPPPDATVPEALWPSLRRHPHPPGSASQLRGLGAQTYAEWPYERLGPLSDPRPPQLYQAQHGPLYYHLVAWLSRMLSDRSDYETIADLARGANVFLGALACVLWFVSLRDCLPGPPGERVAALATLLLAANSVFLYDIARVANDALALFLGSLAIMLYCRWFKRDRGAAPWIEVGRAVVLGGVVGCGVLAKATILPVLAVLVCGVVVSPAGAPSSAVRRRLVRAGAIIASYGAVAGWYHVLAYARFGVLVPSQEAVRNHAAGVPLTAAWSALWELPSDVLTRLFLWNWLYVGGWSGLPLPAALSTAFRLVVAAAAIVFLVAIYNATRRREVVRQLQAAWELPALVMLAYAALLTHAVQSQTAWGHPTTGTWYAAIALPALAWLLLLATSHVPPVVGTGLAVAFLVVFATAHYAGTLGEQLLYQTQNVAQGIRAGVAEAHIHHPVLHWPLFAWIPVEMGLLAGLGALGLRPSSTRD